MSSVISERPSRKRPSADVTQQPAIDTAEYGRLLGKLCPQPIHSEADHERMLALLLSLDEKDGSKGLTPEEATAYELLAMLIEQFEEKHYPILGPTPADCLKRLMKENEMAPKDLLPVLATRARVSEVLSGKRGISKAQAKKLGELFCVSPILFI